MKVRVGKKELSVRLLYLTLLFPITPNLFLYLPKINKIGNHISLFVPFHFSFYVCLLYFPLFYSEDQGGIHSYSDVSYLVKVLHRTHTPWMRACMCLNSWYVIVVIPTHTCSVWATYFVALQNMSGESGVWDLLFILMDNYYSAQKIIWGITDGTQSCARKASYPLF